MVVISEVTVVVDGIIVLLVPLVEVSVIASVEDGELVLDVPGVCESVLVSFSSVERELVSVEGVEFVESRVLDLVA